MEVSLEPLYPYQEDKFERNRSEIELIYIIYLNNGVFFIIIHALSRNFLIQARLEQLKAR